MRLACSYSVLACLTAAALGCGGQSGSPSGGPSAEAARPSEAPNPLPRPRVGEPPRPAHHEALDAQAFDRLIRFLPLLADQMEAAEQGGGPVFRLSATVDPEVDKAFWRRFGPYVQERFGAGFGYTWRQTWAAYAIIEGERRMIERLEAMRGRLRDPKLPSQERAAIERRLQALQEGTAPALQLGGAMPKRNIELARSRRPALAALSQRFFKR